MIVVEGECTPISSPKNVSHAESSLWGDNAFDTIKFTNTRLPFPKDIIGNYKVVYNNPSSKLSNLKGTHLLRVIHMKHADREKHSKTKTKLVTELYNYKGNLTKNQSIIETLHKEKDTLTRKLEEA